jgi:hypothetical protein
VDLRHRLREGRIRSAESVNALAADAEQLCDLGDAD